MDCQSGKMVGTEMTDHEWRMEFDEEYLEQYELIVNAEVVKQGKLTTPTLLPSY